MITQQTELLKASWIWSKVHRKEQNPFHDLLDGEYWTGIHILFNICFLLEKQNSKILEQHTARKHRATA